MSIHPPITGAEAADRLAIRELVDAYAHCADRRDAKGQMALFTAATRFMVFMDATAAEPTRQLEGVSCWPRYSTTSIPTPPLCTSNGQSTV